MGLQHTGNPETVGRELEASLSRLALAGRHLLVAASGGVDSTVLAHALAARRDAHDLRLTLAHVHHGLRGAEADADERCVAALARRLGVRFERRRIEPGSLRAGRGSLARPTLQEAAKERPCNPDS